MGLVRVYKLRTTHWDGYNIKPPSYLCIIFNVFKLINKVYQYHTSMSSKLSLTVSHHHFILGRPAYRTCATLSVSDYRALPQNFLHFDATYLMTSRARFSAFASVHPSHAQEIPSMPQARHWPKLQRRCGSLYHLPITWSHELTNSAYWAFRPSYLLQQVHKSVLATFFHCLARPIWSPTA